MKRVFRCIWVITFLVLALECRAQTTTDKIFHKDGSTLSVKVLEVLPTEIKYKKASNPNGPTYTILKTDVTRIVYANGEEEWMSAAPTQPAVPVEELPFGVEYFLTFSGDGKYMITDRTLADQKRYLCFWDADFKLKNKLNYSNRTSSNISLNWQMQADDGRFVEGAALYAKDKSLIKQFVDPQTKKPFQNVIAVLSPNGKRVLINKYLGNNGWTKGTDFVFLLNSTGEVLTTKSYNIKYVYGGVTTMRFSPSGDHYFIVWCGKVFVFDADGNQVGEIGMQEASVNKRELETDLGYYNIWKFVSFSNDGKYIIAPDSEDEVAIWDLKGVLIKRFPHFMPEVATISRDGKWVATASNPPYGKTVKHKLPDGTTELVSDSRLKIWNIDGTLVKEVSFPVKITSLEFVPDNSGVVGVVEGAAFWLWAKDGYNFPEGMDKDLKLLAADVAVWRKAKQKALNREKWGMVIGGFIDGIPQAARNINQEMAKAEKQRKQIDQWSGGGQSNGSTTTGSTSRKGERLQIVIENKTTKHVESVYISPRESSAWSEDILGKDLLFTGEFGTLTIPSDYGKGCFFDLKVVYPDGKTEVWKGLDFCKYYTFQLFPGGKVMFTVD